MSIKSIKEIFNGLEGNWLFDRKIKNLTTNTLDFANGKASFTFLDKNDYNSLYYEETGVLSLSSSSKKINFTRKYIYQLKDDTIDILLNDGVTKGELFQSLIPLDDGNSFVGTEHVCRLDLHNGKYFFKNESSFDTEYTVKGSNSNLEIKSVYTKIEN